MLRRNLVASVALAALGSLATAAWHDMDYGPFLSATFQVKSPSGNVVYRGVAVPFFAPLPGETLPESGGDKGKKKPQAPPKPGESGIIFDTEQLRVAAAWTGGFLQLDGVAFSGSHGANPSPRGNLLFTTAASPGWAKDEDFKDPRPITHGPLPRDWARYKGLYRHEKGVVFSYTVGDCDVLDRPAVEVEGSHRLVVRELTFGPRDRKLDMVVADFEPGTTASVQEGLFRISKGTESMIARAEGASLQWQETQKRLRLTLAPGKNPLNAKIVLWRGDQKDGDAAAAASAKRVTPVDLAPLTKGSGPLWKDAVVAKGKRAEDKSAYVIDDLTPPFDNPYKSWMRFGGFDLFKDGRAAVCTWSGDVWIVSGIDDKLEKLTWKRFAAGLFQPLGLKIVNDQIYTLGRDGLVRLHDLNGDGEADYYECFNNDFMVTQNFHEFIFDLHTDPEGNFYFIKGGPVRPGGRGWDKVVPHHGCIFKVSKDGKKLDVVARGFRAPNGMGVGPNGEITCGDNEGTWTPTCPINWIKQGGFYGVPDFADRMPKPVIRDNPLCWLPRNIDNSNGGQVWITGKAFGPLSGQMLHMSYGTSTMYNVLKEEVGGEMQGGVAQLLKFESGVCRARFHEGQNALYVSGLRGWQTNASKDAGLYRVRYTGKKAYLPIGLNVAKDAVKVTFTDPLDKSYALDVDNYSVETWNYRWTENYGSAQFKPSNPKQQGHDALDVDEATLSSDGKTVTLKIADLKPVMQMKIAFTLKAADGTPVKTSIHNTINVVGDLRGEIHPGELKVVQKK